MSNLEFKLGARVQIKAESTAYDFQDGGGFVGRYLPSYGYWITERNFKFLKGLVDKGVAHIVDPNSAPFPEGSGLNLATGPGQIGAAVTIGAK